VWHVLVACSSCDEESEVVVSELDDVDREACGCGHGFVVLAVAAFEPLHAPPAEPVRLPRRRNLPIAA
jgi:hypothetical protein